MLQVVTQFLKLETLLDDSVDQKIVLQIERGGTSLTVNFVVSPSLPCSYSWLHAQKFYRAFSFLEEKIIIFSFMGYNLQ